jgi:hypothetical protein
MEKHVFPFSYDFRTPLLTSKLSWNQVCPLANSFQHSGVKGRRIEMWVKRKKVKAQLEART